MSYGEEYLADHAYEMEFHDCVCGTCRWNRHDGKAFCCGNENSDRYGEYTMYADSCEEYEEKTRSRGVEA